MVCLDIVLVFLIFAVTRVLLLKNGLALTPPMGWMSWGYYMCNVDCDNNPEKCLNEELILSVADTFFSEGYQEAGYEYIIIDDCWSEMERDENDNLVADRKRFPRGMKFLADYIHERGLKFGMYTNVAEVTCMRYPGSRDHFQKDADAFASWGIDYLKVDGCYVSEKYLNTAYIELGNALKKTGRPIVYSCSWPYYIEFIHNKKPDYGPIAEHCNLWRNYHDVFTVWGSVRGIIQHYEQEYPFIAAYHGPGQWNDADMLIFGTDALTPSQSRIHISVHAMLSSPLLLSCDLRRMTPYEKELALNLDLIAVAQDPKGIMAKPYMSSNSVTLWVKPHYPMKGDRFPSYSFLFVNMAPPHNITRTTTMTITPGHYGLNSTDGYSVLDVFTSSFLKNITLADSLTVHVPFEGTYPTLQRYPAALFSVRPSLSTPQGSGHPSKRSATSCQET